MLSSISKYDFKELSYSVCLDQSVGTTPCLILKDCSHSDLPVRAESIYKNDRCKVRLPQFFPAQYDLSQGFSKCGPQTASSAFPGNLLEMEILWPPSQTNWIWNSEGWNPATCILTSPPGDSDVPLILDNRISRGLLSWLANIFNSEKLLQICNLHSTWGFAD